MPELLPFRASWIRDRCDWARLVYVPGVQRPPELNLEPKCVHTDPEQALYLYRQRFRLPGETRDSVREGVVGLLGNERRENVYLHEETLPEGVIGCREERMHLGAEASSLFLWCNDKSGELGRALHVRGPVWREVTDDFGCLHQFWRVAEEEQIRAIQSSICGKDLFLADGHHRFAAGWRLATVQIRNEALQPFRDNSRGLCELEAAARARRLLPPKSTDFYPKLLGRLLLHRS